MPSATSSNDLIDPVAAFSTSRCKALNANTIPIHVASSYSILFLMLYQPYAIFFEIDNGLYIKFETLNWSTFLPNII